MRILAADIGGTNSRFAAFRQDGSELIFEESIWLPSGEAASFCELLEQLEASSFPLAPQNADVQVFAAAGPVVEKHRATPPNISWDINLQDLPEHLESRSALLVNDFVAQAYACLGKPGEQSISILEGTAVEGAPVAVLGAGTGLGKCLLVPTGKSWLTVASEGGHAVFPFVGHGEAELAKFLCERSGRKEVDGDMILTGSGLRALHAFHTGEELSSHEVAKKMVGSSNVLAWFARFYGRSCRNFVLDTLAFGGVFLAGGIAAGNPHILRHPEFVAAFYGCETHGELLRKVPVRLMTDTEAGLWGAALYGTQHAID